MLETVERYITPAGLLAVIKRNDRLGYYCGYVGVPKSNRYYGKHYENFHLNVHGGLTFSDIGDDKYLPAGFWWYGYDTNHGREFDETQTIEYNIRQCNLLASQLKESK